MSGFQDAIDKLGSAIGDFSSLEVQTITGNLTGIINPAPVAGAPSPTANTGGSIINWEKAIAEAKTAGTVNLVLATKINFDGDASMFIRSGEIPPYMLEAHAKAVTAGLQVRSDLAKLASESIIRLLNP